MTIYESGLLKEANICVVCPECNICDPDVSDVKIVIKSVYPVVGHSSVKFLSCHIATIYDY